MHSLLGTSLFMALITSALSYRIPDATVELLKPKGFRLSLPHEEGITDVSFNVKIDQRIALYQPGDYAAVLKELTDGKWAFDNINTSVKPGSRINYWVHVQFGQLGKNFREVGSAIVSSDSAEVSIACTDGGGSASTTQQCPASSVPNCEPSITTVGGKPACKGELIFEDNFESLDWKKWSPEVRIPLAMDDGQFVSYQNRPENCYASNNQLHIIPSLQSMAKGFDLGKIRAGKLDLGAQCTAIVDRPNECRKQAQFYQILPPVVSARIRTKNSFTFRYGRVQVRAKLPRGDWLFPLILLEPLENFYGVTGYASGQIRIAFNRGNQVLVNGGKDISNKILLGGAVMTNDEQSREDHKKRKNTQMDLSSDFHTYALTWTDKELVLEVDGINYAIVKENFSQAQARYHGNTNRENIMAPFDREFFLTLGVSAGGHSDFPDTCRNGPTGTPKPWQNGDPKAELYFWKDRNNWFKTWNTETSGLHVDNVKVFAL